MSSASAGPRRGFHVLAVVLVAMVAAAVALVAQHARRDFSVTAYQYGYRVSGTDQPEIRVQQDDLVRIQFAAEDIAHSFTVDDYRISKRAEPGKPVTFEFRADRPGTFEIYCSLTIDDRCRRETKGRLVVMEK